MLRSRLCDNSDVYILVKGTMSIAVHATQEATQIIIIKK